MEWCNIKMMKIIMVLSCVCVYVSMFDLTFEKTELSYVNEKYYNIYNYTLRRANRKSPYIFNLYQDIKYPIGNNLTYKFTLYEVISGREILTPVHLELRLCDTLYKDKYIGKLFADQLPKNWVCPFPVGIHNWTIVLKFINWPFLPFTYSSLYVRISTTIDGYINNELANQGRMYAVLKQNMQDQNIKPLKTKH